MRHADEKTQNAEEGTTLSSRFFLLLILGFILVFVGIIAILVSAVLYDGSSASFGAVIFIGPFPIVIGAGPETSWVVLFSVILAVLSVIMFFVMNRRIRGSRN